MIYEIDALSFAYSPRARRVLNNVSLDVHEGEIVSILGRNGAGKSTLLRCMLGLNKPQGGSIRLCGEPIETLGERRIASQVGFVAQTHGSAFGYTVFEYVLMGCASHVGLLEKPSKADEARAYAALEKLNITSLAARPCTEISGGERQQAAIARAIAASPKAVLFDEPTAHLDFGNRIQVLRILRDLAQSGYAVVVTTHEPDHALLLGGTVALLDNEGCLFAGTAQETLTSERLSSIYGADVHLDYVEALGRVCCLPPKL